MRELFQLIVINQKSKKMKIRNAFHKDVITFFVREYVEFINIMILLSNRLCMIMMMIQFNVRNLRGI